MERRMPMSLLVLLLILLWTRAVVVAPTDAAPKVASSEKRITLDERLGQTWRQELVTYPFSAKRGACRAQRLRLQGAGGLLPVQLSEVELWPDGTVKNGKVSFITDLDPRETRTHTLTWPGTAKAPRIPGSALMVVESAGAVEVSSGSFTARLLLGEKTYPEAVAAEEAPGPVLNLRLADGRTFGGSRLFGPGRVKSWSAKVLDRGPVFACVECVYTYADDNTARHTFQVNAGDNALMWDTEVKEDRPEEGCDLLLSTALPTLIFPVHMEWFTKRKVFLDKGSKVGDLEELSLDTYPDEKVTTLTPWNDWWDDYTQTVIPLKLTETNTELQISSRDPGAWVEPAAPGTMRDWGAWQHKLVSLLKGKEGEVFLRLNNAQGLRRWTLSEGAPRVGHRLNVVKDYILDWPQSPKIHHPHLFVSQQRMQEYFNSAPHDPKRIKELVDQKPEIRSEPSYKDAYALEAWLRSGGDPKLAEELQLVERLRRHLNLLGNFDVMRNTGLVACLYDALVETDLVSADDRKLFRSQIAYLAYKINDPSTWSIERGYRSYNENMSVSHLLGRGILASLLPDHPMARQWAQPAIDRLKLWLQAVGPEGEWFEGGHYDQVTYSTMIWFAIACQRAGFHDFLSDPAFKRFGLYIAKQQTARDLQRGGRRVPPPLGRATAGVPWGHFGLLAQAYRDLDPEYSRIMQWCWAENGYNMNIMDSRLGGLEVAYMDPSLPKQKPDWSSDWFPQVGAIFRNGAGTENETYLNLLVNSKIEFARVSEPGSVLKWIAKGRPIAGAFSSGYQHRHELLMSRVIRARGWQPGDNWLNSFGNTTTTTEARHAFLPTADYVSASYDIGAPYDASWWAAATPEDLPSWPPVAAEGKIPFRWQRQSLMMKDKDASGPNYLILRDTVTGGQPTAWQFWTLSEKVGTPEETRNLETFLADKPGEKPLPPRPLVGDRFTAVGQFDLDLEYFIASPSATPRHTLRYSAPFVDYGVVGRDNMDLLHLQLPGDGAYFVALYPRLRTEPAPTFATMGDGMVIQIRADWGTDYAFLSPTEKSATANEAHFRGTCAAVQDRRNGLLLALGDTGEVACRQYGLQCDEPISLRVGDVATIQATSKHPDMQPLVTLPGEWRLAVTPVGVRWEKEGDGRWRLTLPGGVSALELVRK